MKRILFCSASTCAAFALLNGTSAAAQAGQTAPAQLGEVVVTSQKRAENVQDVPISVQVLSGVTIANAGFRNIQDLAQSTPSLRAQKGPSGDSVGIRGVQAPNGASFEQAVGVFIDGIYFGRSRSLRAGFLDIDRAEILKGPQSIYFGNNAIAGAYNIVTANPGKALNGYLRAGFEPVADEVQLEAAVGGPINDTMGLRLAASYSHIEGWLKNPFAGRGPGTNDMVARATWTWTRNESFDVNAKAGFYDIKGVNGQGFELHNCPVKPPFTVSGTTCTGSIALGADLDLNWVNVNNPLFNRQKGKNAVITANYHFGGGFTLTSVTGWWKMDYGELFDQDYSPLQVGSNFNDEFTRQTSQEFRLTSLAEKPLSFIVGAYYHDQDRTNSQMGGTIAPTPAQAVLVPANTFPLQRIFSSYHEQSISAFGAATYRFTDALRATVGLRRIHVEKKDYRENTLGYATDLRMGSYTLLPAAQQVALSNALFRSPLGVFSGNFTVEQSDWLPSFNAEWDIAPDKMIYVSASKGFQAGGFDEGTRTLTTSMTFAPETVVAKEIGLKAQWFNRRLTTNIDYFHAKYSDLQRSVAFVPPGSNVGLLIVSSVGTQVSQGVEVQVNWRATDRLDLTLNATALSSKYGSDVVGGCSQTQTFLTPAGQPCLQNLGGKSPQGTPPYSGEFTARYVQPIGSNLQLSAQGNVFFSGHFEQDGSYDVAGHQKAFQRYGFRLALSPVAGPWELALVARNITNQKVKLSCGPATGATGSYGCVLDRKNSYMMQASYRF